VAAVSQRHIKPLGALAHPVEDKGFGPGHSAGLGAGRGAVSINGMFWVAVAGALVNAVGLSFAVASRDRWLVAVAVVAIMVAFADAAVQLGRVLFGA
jgi:hypothetical protein